MKSTNGDIDISQIIENEFRIKVLEKIIDLIMSKNPQLRGFSDVDLDKITHEATLELDRKYPRSGIKYTKK